MFNVKGIVLFVILSHIAVHSNATKDGCAGGSISKSQTLLLKESLLPCGYNKELSQFHQNGIVTELDVTLILEYVTINEFYGYYYFEGWTVWEWTDERLKWNSSKFGGLERINLDTEDIWIPKLYPSHETTIWGNHGLFYPDGRCLLIDFGYVVCVTPHEYSAKCTPRLTNWPNDIIKCQIAYWMEGHEVMFHISNENVSLMHYMKNSDWDLISTRMRNVSYDMYSDLANHSVSNIVYDFTFKRHASFHQASVIFPAYVCVFLVLVTFWLEISGDIRIYISCVSLICHCLQLQQLGYKLAGSMKETPLILEFYCMSMVFCALGLLTTIIVRLVIKLQNPPVWMIQALNLVLKYHMVQVLLALNLQQQEDTAIKEEAGEGDGLVKTSSQAVVVSWVIIGKLLDRICFTLLLILYMWFLFIKYVV